MAEEKVLHMSSGPHVRSRLKTSSVMLGVIISLMPATIIGIWNFGPSALGTVLASVVAAVLTEYLFDRIVHKENTVKDGSAVVTGILLALVLPNGTPLYIPIIGAVRELLHLNFSYLPVLAVFGLGVMAGIIGIIRIVKNALEQHRAAMVYFILGLMLGSLYAIIMGPTTLKVPQPAMTLDTFSPLCFILGGVFLYILERLRRFSEAKLHPEAFRAKAEEQ